jgi:magnesium chelatase subunit H
MFKRLFELNPDSVSSLTKRLLEAHNRGYWNPDEEILEKLERLGDNQKNPTDAQLLADTI